MSAHHHEEALSGPSTEGSVILDIGGDIGAAVIFTPESLLGSEIEIRPEAGEWIGTHTGVRERRMGTDVRYAGVFGALAQGSYQLRVKGSDGGVVHNVDVAGGRVTQTQWPS